MSFGIYAYLGGFMRENLILCVDFTFYAFLNWKSGLSLWESAFHLESEGFSLDGEGADDVGDERQDDGDRDCVDAE